MEQHSGFTQGQIDGLKKVVASFFGLGKVGYAPNPGQDFEYEWKQYLETGKLVPWYSHRSTGKETLPIDQLFADAPNLYAQVQELKVALHNQFDINDDLSLKVLQNEKRLAAQVQKQKEVIEKLVAALEHAKQFVSSGVIESALLTAKENDK